MSDEGLDAMLSAMASKTEGIEPPKGAAARWATQAISEGRWQGRRRDWLWVAAAAALLVVGSGGWLSVEAANLERSMVVIEGWP